MFGLWFLHISSFLGFLGWLHLCYLLKIRLAFINLIYFNNFWWASAWMMIILHLPDKCIRHSAFFCTWFSRYLNKKEEVCFLELITYLGQLPLTSTLTYIPFTSVYARKKTNIALCESLWKILLFRPRCLLLDSSHNDKEIISYMVKSSIFVTFLLIYMLSQS